MILTESLITLSDSACVPSIIETVPVVGGCVVYTLTPTGSKSALPPTHAMRGRLGSLNTRLLLTGTLAGSKRRHFGSSFRLNTSLAAAATTNDVAAAQTVRPRALWSTSPLLINIVK